MLKIGIDEHTVCQRIYWKLGQGNVLFGCLFILTDKNLLNLFRYEIKDDLFILLQTRLLFAKESNICDFFERVVQVNYLIGQISQIILTHCFFNVHHNLLKIIHVNL